MLSEAPIVIEGHAFTTGVVPRTSIEHVLPNTWVEVGVKDGLGCDANAYIEPPFHRRGTRRQAGSRISIGTSMPPASVSAIAGWW